MKSKGLHNKVVGRFAPSPTGALHFGSLVAATASYLNAKKQDGTWFVRIDDLDRLRVVPNADSVILSTLDAFGFEWSQVVYQSSRIDNYQSALSFLQAKNLIYACECTRQQLKLRSKKFPLYDQFCLRRSLTFNQNTIFRFKAALFSQQEWVWHDLIQGEQRMSGNKDYDDFIIKRRDGVFSYHLACAVDDLDFGITEVIRGQDLLSSTPPQQLIQLALEKTPPCYGHHSLVLDPVSGIKLSKASHAKPLDEQQKNQLLAQALNFLGYTPPKELNQAPVMTLWEWSIENWKVVGIA